MKLAFDEHIPPGIVKVFQVLADEGATQPVSTIVTARTYAESADKGDDQHWVRRFSADGGSIIISGDKRMRGLPHQRKALIDEGMIVFFFSPAWNGKNGYVKSAMLLNWWPKIISVVENAPSGSLWKIPMAWTCSELEQVVVPPDPQ